MAISQYVPQLSFGQAALGACAATLLYCVALGVYRLYFHPLRHIPGPKLAALTYWVETYYECFKSPGGQFMWEYQKWHETYGPIVRVGPDEVHIQDPAFYETLYAQSRHSDKLKKLEHRFNNEMASFATAEHAVHRMRRGALNPFFSKRRIAQYSPNIQHHMDRLTKRVADEYAGTGKILNMTNMWGAFTTDIVVGYCLEEPYDFIMNKDFRAEFADAMTDLCTPVHFITQFPWMIKFSKMLPDRLVAAMYPPMQSVFNFNNEMEKQILRAKAVHLAASEKAPGRRNSATATTGVYSSIFTALLESDLPPSQLETQRLQHEAISVIGAGVETTMFTLMTGSFHMMRPINKERLVRLQAELKAAIPDPNVMIDVDSLMQLPWLTCVVNEALRFAYGTPQRIPRLSPTPMVYTPTRWTTGREGPSYDLPVGSVVSMDHYTASHDKVVFPEPMEFLPDRWEGNPVAPDGRPLSRYLIAFGRGTRSCVGMQLAYADLYIGFATWFRRFEAELFETERDAVDVYMDLFVPRPKPGTEGVRIKVKSVLD